MGPTFTRTFVYKFRLGSVLAYFWGWFEGLFKTIMIFGGFRCFESVPTMFPKSSHVVKVPNGFPQILNMIPNMFPKATMRNNMGNSWQTMNSTHMGLYPT